MYQVIIFNHIFSGFVDSYSWTQNKWLYFHLYLIFIGNVYFYFWPPTSYTKTSLNVHMLVYSYTFNLIRTNDVKSHFSRNGVIIRIKETISKNLIYPRYSTCLQFYQMPCKIEYVHIFHIDQFSKSFYLIDISTSIFIYAY